MAPGILASRWGRRLTGAAVGLVVVAAIGVPVVLTSDWWNVSYAAAARRPAPTHPTEPPGAVRPAWSAAGLRPSGSPLGSATVLTAGRHEIAGHDPATGALRWHYRRDNAALCSWAIANSTAVAVFRNAGSCSDITGFDPDTGMRRWYRNADLGGQVGLVAAPNVVVATEHLSLTAFYTDGGGDAWTFSKRGCTIGPVAGGDIGVIVLTDCGRRGQFLVGLDSYTGDTKWTVAAGGEHPQVVGADGHVTLLSRIGGRAVLSVFTATGHAVGSVSGHGLTDPGARLPTGTLAGDRLVAYDGSRVVAVDLHRPDFAWSVPATGPADVEGNVALVPGRTGLTEYDVATGRPLRRISADGMPHTPTTLARIGPRIAVVSSDATTVLG